MDQNSWDFIGAPDCAQRSATSLLQTPHQFIEDVTFKTDLIEPAGLANTSLLSDVYLLRDIARDVIKRSYNQLPFLTFVHICAALDYFVTIVDANPDFRKDGLFDDIKVISRTRERFRDEIEQYKKWKSVQTNH